MPRFMRLLGLLPLLVFAPLASAERYPAHSPVDEAAITHAAHVHGVAELDLAIDAGAVTLELRLPGDSAVGFESAATTPAEHAALAAARERLVDALSWLRPATAAGCSVQTSDLTTPESLEVDSTEKAASKPGQHGNRHDAHSHHHHANEQHIDGEHDHASAAQHVDWSLSVSLNCTTAAALWPLDLAGLFSQFPRIQQLKVQLIVDALQTSAALTPRDTRIEMIP